MTNNYERVPTYVNQVYSDLKSDSKYFLTKKNVRATLLAGYSFGAVMIIVPMLIAYTVMFSTPIKNDEYQIHQALLVYISIWMGIFLMLPGIYCGMYTALLKISAGQRATVSDLFGYYMSPRMYFRGVGIFIRSNWFLLGIGIVLIINLIASILGGMSGSEELKMSIDEIFSAILMLYLAIGSIVWAVSRKKIFIFLPYAIENPHVSLKQCASVSKQINPFYYAKSYPNDYIMTLLWLALSLLTVGILFVVHVGPMMMAKKISFYRSSMVNKFN